MKKAISTENQSQGFTESRDLASANNIFDIYL